MVETGVLSLLPAFITILLAFATRQVIPALFAGVLTGSLVLVVSGVALLDAEPVRRFFLPAVGSNGYARILLIYLWCLGGLIGLWKKTGGAYFFAETISKRFVRTPKGSLLFAWCLGVLFHQGGTISTVLAGSTIKPVADRHRISHEELSYIVDSTASPVATVLPFNAWPVYIASLVVGSIPLLQTESQAVSFFFASIPYNFYGIFAVLLTLALALGFRPIGRGLRNSQVRAREKGQLDAPGADPIMPKQSLDDFSGLENYKPSLLDFFGPIGVLLSVAVLPLVIFGQSFVEQAFLLCVLSGIGIAAVKGMALRDILDGFIQGCQSMTIGAIILGLAVTLATVSKELGTAAFVVEILGDQVPKAILPAALCLLCMVIAFATGTSWGTYAVVFPIALPLAFAVYPSTEYLHICFGAVLGGAVFGDQCSPISDTTILSSMFTGCDMMDHVKTQIPPALTAAGAGILISCTLASL